LTVPHQERKVYVVTSPATSDVYVHETDVGSLAPAELQVYPRCLALGKGARDREASGVAPVREAVEVHAVAVTDVVVDCLMVAKVAGPQIVALPRNIQPLVPVAAAYAATWSAGDDAVVAHVEVELAATAVVVLRVQTQD
jgi:hypothetical protein